MNDWTETTLKEIISVSSGEGLSESKMRPGNYPVYGGNGINGYHDSFLFEESKLIIGRVGAHCGNIHLTDKYNWITDNALIVSFLDKEQDVNFWYYNLSELRIRQYAFEGAQPVITGGTIGKIKLKIPTPKIQTRIAQILSNIDAVIEKTQAAIAKYKAIKQGMLRDLFTRGIDLTTNKLRPSYHDAPELYKESKLGWIPKEWDAKDFGKEIDLIHGHQFRDYDFTEFGIPVIKIGQVKPENIDLTYCSFVNYGREEEFKNEIICNDDVLMALTGATLGKACLVKGLNGIVYQNYRVGRFEPIILENDIDKKFLYYLLIAGELLAQIFNKVNTGAQGNIGKADFEKATFKKPPFDEQLKIAERLQTIDNKLQSEQTYLHKLQKIKKGLMEDLLSGKKLVKVPEELETKNKY